MPITEHPLHGSGRADFPHPALASGDDAKPPGDRDDTREQEATSGPWAAASGPTVRGRRHSRLPANLQQGTTRANSAPRFCRRFSRVCPNFVSSHRKKRPVFRPNPSKAAVWRTVIRSKKKLDPASR